MIEVGVDGPNYHPIIQLQSKRKRRARQQEDLRDKEKTLTEQKELTELRETQMEER